jgi:hypothetical protein
MAIKHKTLVVLETLFVVRFVSLGRPLLVMIRAVSLTKPKSMG